MLLIIHNLPLNIKIANIKKLIKDNCGLTEVILDNLTNEGAGKRVTVGLVDEGDAALMVRKMNGLFVGAHQLYVADARNKKGFDQPYRPPNVPAPKVPEPVAPPSLLSLSQPMQYDSMQVQQMMGQAYSNMPFYVAPVQSSYVPYDKTSAVTPLSQVPFYQQEYAMGYQQQPENKNRWIDQQQVVSYPTKQFPSVNPDPIVKERDLSRKRQSPSRDDSERNWRDRRESPERSDNYRQRNRKPRPDGPDPRTRNARRSRSREMDKYSRRDEMRSRSKRDRSPPRAQRYGRDDFERRPDDRGREADRRDGPYNKRNRDEHRERFESREYDNNREHDVNRGRDNSRRTRWDTDYKRDSNHDYDFEQKAERSDYDRRSPQRFEHDDSAYDPNYETNTVTYSSKPNNSTFTHTQSNYQSRQYNDDGPPAKTPRLLNVNVEKQFTEVAHNVNPMTSFSAKIPRLVNVNVEKQFTDVPRNVKPMSSFPVSNDSAAQSSNSRHPKHVFWVKHACGILSKEVMKNAKAGFVPNYADVLKTIFKCIESRFDVILEGRYVESLGEVLESYRVKFDIDDDPHFFKAVLEKMQRDKKETGGGKNAGEKPQHKNAPDAAYANTGAIPKKKGYVPPPEKPKKQNKNQPPQGLPRYPQGQKEVYKAQKKMSKLEWKRGDVYKMNPDLDSAANEELVKLCKEFLDACGKHAADPIEDEIRGRIKGEVTVKFRKAVKLHLAKRLLNVTQHLVVRIFACPKMPRKADLDPFLRNLGVTSFRKSDLKKMYLASVPSYKVYDKLIKLGNTMLGDITISFKPLHLTGPPDKKSKKQQQQPEEKEEIVVSDEEIEKLINETDEIDENVPKADDEIVNNKKPQAKDEPKVTENVAANAENVLHMESQDEPEIDVNDPFKNEDFTADVEDLNINFDDPNSCFDNEPETKDLNTSDADVVIIENQNEVVVIEDNERVISDGNSGNTESKEDAEIDKERNVENSTENQENTEDILDSVDLEDEDLEDF